MQRLVMSYLRAEGPHTAPEIARNMGLSLASIRQACARLAPPPVGIGALAVLDGDRFVLAPERLPAPEPERPCRVRQSGKHAPLCSNPERCAACGERVAA